MTIADSFNGPATEGKTRTELYGRTEEVKAFRGPVPRPENLPEDYKEFTASLIAKRASALTPKKEDFTGIHFCRISGLPLFYASYLPPEARVVQIDFDRLSTKAVQSAYRKALQDSATVEQKIFSFFSLLRFAPVIFQEVHAHPELSFWGTKRGEKILTVGLPRLFSFVSWFERQPERVKLSIPRFHLTKGSAFWQDETRTDDFRGFFAVLSRWEALEEKLDFSITALRAKTELLQVKAIAESFEEREIAGVWTTVCTDPDAAFAAIEKKVSRDATGGKEIRANLFNPASAKHKEKLPNGQRVIRLVLRNLAEAFDLNLESFSSAVLSPMSLSMDRIQSLIDRISDTDKNAEELPLGYSDLLIWLRTRLEIRKGIDRAIHRMEMVELYDPEKIKEDRVQAEEEKAKLGAPLRGSFPAGSSGELSFIRATAAWKRERGAGAVGSVKIIPPTSSVSVADGKDF